MLLRSHLIDALERLHRVVAWLCVRDGLGIYRRQRRAMLELLLCLLVAQRTSRRPRARHIPSLLRRGRRCC
jgi:hypothetical protein